MGGFTFAHLPGGVFDARSVDPTPQFTVPALDDYIVGIVKEEAKENKQKEDGTKTGGHIEFTLEIQQSKGGSQQFAKINVPYRLNLFHTDSQVMAIAYKQLSALCHVTGILTPTKPADLICNPQTGRGYFIATIGPQKDNPQFPNVFAVKDIQGNSPGRSGTAVAASPAPPAPAPAMPFPPAQPAAAPAAAPWGAPAQPAQQPAPWGAPAAAPAPAAPAAPPWGPPQPAYAQPAAPAAPAPAAPPWGPPQAAPQAAPAQPATPWDAPAAQPAAAPAPGAPPWAR